MKRFTFLAVVLLAGCSENQGNGGSRDPDAVQPYDGKIHLHQRGLSPGSTNASTTPVLGLAAAPTQGGVITAQLAATLADVMAFNSADGQEVIAANVTLADVTLAEPGFVVTPAVPLRADAWYQVRWPATPSIVIHSDDTYYLGTDVLTRFYTGSAPQLRKLEVAGGGDVPVSKMLVYLSELVDLEDVRAGGIAVTGPTFSGDPCISWTGGCLQPGSTGQVVSVFQYEFATELPARFELAMALSLRGVTESVGEAAGKGAIRGTTLANDRSLLYELDRTDWRPRHNAGTFGWSNAE